MSERMDQAFAIVNAEIERVAQEAGRQPSPGEFWHIIDEALFTSVPDRIEVGYTMVEWDPPAEGDVLPNGTRGHYHARIDRSAGRALNIGRH